MSVSPIGTVQPMRNRPAPRQEQLYLETLSVDPSVQRSVDPNWVKRELERFSPFALGSLVISARNDNTFKVVDGQHRVQLCREFGYAQPLECLVYRNLTLAEEALMFRVLNNRRKVPPIDLFKVSVVEGEKCAVDLDALLTKYGWHVTAAKSKGGFGAVSSLRKVYTGYGQKPAANLGICESVISTITNAWGLNPHGARGEIITGLGLIFSRHGNKIDMPKLITEMANTQGGPLVLCGKAKILRDVSGGKIGDGMATNFINMHNKGRRTNRLPDWMAQ